MSARSLFPVCACTLVLALALLFVAPAPTNAAAAPQKIKHVVYLMLENRAFDHLLGYQKLFYNDTIRGLTGQESCPASCSDPNGPRYFVDPDANYTGVSPGHQFTDTQLQAFCSNSPPVDPTPSDETMQGFISSASQAFESPQDVMKCFQPSTIPAIATLSQEFALFDMFFSSFPGPTIINRLFALSGTSQGFVKDDALAILLGWPQESFLEQMSGAGVSWRNYFEIAPSSMILRGLRDKSYLDHYRMPITSFQLDALNGDLPAFSWLDPNYYSDLIMPANDAHPQHDVALADMLVAHVYEALRASPLWEESALIISFDEHGGFYDHVSPPCDAPNPDGISSTDPPFDFHRLGVRVPTIVVSPLIPKGTIVHEPPPEAKPFNNSHFEHTSIISTFKHLFNLTDELPPLTQRDAQCAHFDFVFSLDKPRTDCPKTLPIVPLTDQRRAEIREQPFKPVNDLQEHLLLAAAGASNYTGSLEVHTETQAAELMRHLVRRWFNRMRAEADAEKTAAAGRKKPHAHGGSAH